MSLSAEFHQMPQVVLDSVPCGGDGYGKVTCETIIAGAPPAASEEDPDMPADSFRVRIGEEIDWIDVHAVYDRDDSTKGNTNPKSQNSKTQQPHPQSNSQRFSGNLKPKAPIIALPNKLRHSGHFGHSARRPASGVIFPKKKRSSGGKPAPVPEPGSPKVSCFGKVLSNRERESQLRGKAPGEQRLGSGRGSAGDGCWGWLVGIFLCGRHARRERGGEAKGHRASTVSAIAVPPAANEEGKPVVAPMGLAAMKRFSSVRRSASWAGDEDGDAEVHLSWSEPLDRDGWLTRRS